MLMVKGAIDEFRVDAKQGRRMLQDHMDDTKRLREVIDKLLKAMGGCDLAPMPREVSPDDSQ
jgi:hypothetical protein